MANTVHHPEVTESPGDDWALYGTLTDVDGTPLDLTYAAISWTLIAPDGTLAIPNNSAQVAVPVPMTSGLVVINVPRDVTTTLTPGRYTDALRVTIADLRDTIWTGMILVNANFFDIEEGDKFVNYATTIMMTSNPFMAGSPDLSVPTLSSYEALSESPLVVGGPIIEAPDLASFMVLLGSPLVVEVPIIETALVS